MEEMRMLILLADDERMSRIGLQSMLNEISEDDNDYIHARNGQEIINLVTVYKPDIAFIDVKMPLMNGLEALAQCRDISPETIWIILSGYADFEYARTALKYSAIDYILKPIDIDTLKTLLAKIQKIRHESSTVSNIAFSNTITNSFSMADQFGADHIKFQLEGENQYEVYQIYINAVKKQDQHHLKQMLINEINSFCKVGFTVQNYCLFFDSEGSLCLICSKPDMLKINHFFCDLLEKIHNGSIFVFMGHANSIKNAYNISKRIHKISGLRIIMTGNRPYQLEKAERLPMLNAALDFYSKIERLTDCLIGNNHGCCRQLIIDMVKDNSMRMVFDNADKKSLYAFITFYAKKQIVKSNYYEFLNEISNFISMSQKTLVPNAQNKIEEIKDFIRDNYSSDVSISYVSECFDLSPAYLSRIFHDKTGTKYIDFVTETRMEAAKKMIDSKPSTPIKTVSESVGYTSVRHFSKTFQKYTGSLPSQYKEDVM
jgi:YesN/AraC family two-component response regulator